MKKKSNEESAVLGSKRWEETTLGLRRPETHVTEGRKPLQLPRCFHRPQSRSGAWERLGRSIDVRTTGQLSELKLMTMTTTVTADSQCLIAVRQAP